MARYSLPITFIATVSLLSSSSGSSQDWKTRLQDLPVPGIRVSSEELNSVRPPDLDQIIPLELRDKLLHDMPLVSGIVSTFVVTTTNDSGNGSLRRAIMDANANPGLDMITFNIPPAGPKTIAVLSKLPNIIDPVTLDGTTQPGYVDKPIIELNCASMGPFQAFDVYAPGTTIKGMVINRLTGGTGIVLWEGSNGSIIEGNFFGTDLTGTIRVGNVYNGVISRSPNNRIGGTAVGARNLFSGQGNPAIALIMGANENVIQGNLIGTDVTGTVRLGNTEDGILIIFGARDDTIGGTTAAAKNVISGSNNLSGIAVIGTGAAGTQGISILGNHLGTDVTGNLDFGNARHGIYVRHSPNNIIGGTDPGARNVISGNTLPGIQIDSAGATSNVIQGNIIGTRPNGTFALPNSKGIVLNNAPGNLIGGSALGARNLITGNSGVGIEIAGNGATGNKIQGNYIGTNISGQPGPRNLGHGILISASQDTIGGLSQSEGNLIAYNGGAGVFVADGTQNLIWKNRMRLNTGLGIDLAPPGVTVNDSLDPDIGPNALQNFPLLDSAVVTSSNTKIYGRLNSWPNAEYRIHFYKSSSADPLHFGEADSLIGEGLITTDGNGNFSFVGVFPVTMGNDQFITATATNALGNTSEFSQALCVSDLDGDGLVDSWETEGWGIDVNSDNVIDMDLYALGATPYQKDLFVEVDAMRGMSPIPGAIRSVINAFAAGPPAINLHVQLDDTTLDSTPWPTNWWMSFDAIKRDTFGTAAERSSPNRRYILEAKGLAFRYCIFAHSYGTDGSSGQAEVPGDDFMVTLGTWSIPGGTFQEQAGTFMHELGHTLGLRHGGGDNIHFKPNYFSVMNYAWQVPYDWQVPGDWLLAYSVGELPPLDESALDERVGLNAPAALFPVVSMPFTNPRDSVRHARLKPNSPVDWNGNGVIDDTLVTADLNRLDILVDPTPIPGKPLVSHADWQSLTYNFRSSPGFTDQFSLRSTGSDSLQELNLRVFGVLNSLPPPIPQHFIMDGQLDADAVRLTTGDGIVLYAAYRDGELYVATNSAQSQNADMFIFVTADFENPGIVAPWGKSGQVAAWDAFLGNESTDNSVGWYDANGLLRQSITKSSAGSGIVEGVIDVEYMTGREPFSLYLAVGKYQTNDGGILIAQAPPGDGNGDIEANGELYRYTPGTEIHWYQTAGPATPNIFSLMPLGSAELYAGAGNGGYKTTDGGDSWTHMTAGLPTDRTWDFARTGSGNVFAASDAGVFFTTDNGSTWQLRTNGMTDFETRALLSAPLGYLLAGTITAGGFRSTDEGANWTLMAGGLPMGGIKAFAIDSNGHVYAGTTTSGVFKSTDDGITWSQTPIGGNPISLTVDHLGRIYYVSSSPSIVFRSPDGGLSWNNILQTSMSTQEMGVDASGRIYAGTAEGVLLSTDDGSTWIDISGGIPHMSAWSLVVSANNDVYVGTFVDGVCRNVSSVTTSVGTPPQALPTETALYQNYPNPFNPSTIIRYAIQRPTSVTLTVYDLLGRKIATLVNERKVAGNYEVTWNASNRASGMYLYRLEAGSFVQTRKLMLLK